VKKGYIQVYTGDGKGKTTAALGLALRASGRGMRIYIGQFMKGQVYGELAAVERIPEIELEQYGDPGWCYKGRLTEEQFALARRGFERAKDRLSSGAYDIVILDELNMAVWFELLTVDQLMELIACKPETTELVITGRRAHEALIERADLVTEMREVKHYYRAKVPAREGVES